MEQKRKQKTRSANRSPLKNIFLAPQSARVCAFILASSIFCLQAQESQIRSLVKEVRQLTFQGSNSQSFLAPDGDELTYVSERRKTHSQREAYIYDVKKQKERRLTFQLGTIAEPQIHSHDLIFYTGSTDEEQDVASLAFDAGALPRTEIYRSDSWGREIQRLTESPGYDGQWSESKDVAPWVFYVRWAAGQMQIMQSQANESPKPLGGSSKRSIAGDPKRFIADLKIEGHLLYWQEEAKDSGHSEVFSMSAGPKGAQTKTKKLLFTSKAKLSRLTPLKNGEILIGGMHTKEPDDSFVVIINIKEKCAFALLNLFDPVTFGHARWLASELNLVYERKIREDQQVFSAKAAVDVSVCQEPRISQIEF